MLPPGGSILSNTWAVDWWVEGGVGCLPEVHEAPDRLTASSPGSSSSCSYQKVSPAHRQTHLCIREHEHTVLSELYSTNIFFSLVIYHDTISIIN